MRRWWVSLRPNKLLKEVRNESRSCESPRCARSLSEWRNDRRRCKSVWCLRESAEWRNLCPSGPIVVDGMRCIACPSRSCWWRRYPRWWPFVAVLELLAAATTGSRCHRSRPCILWLCWCRIWCTSVISIRLVPSRSDRNSAFTWLITTPTRISTNTLNIRHANAVFLRDNVFVGRAIIVHGYAPYRTVNFRLQQGRTKRQSAMCAVYENK